MNTHLEPQIRHSGVTNLGNRPAITCNLCLAVTNLDAQSAVPRINRAALKAFVAGVGELLPAGGLFMLYGPFSYGGRHTSESNAPFDLRLKQQDPQMGIRDFDDLNVLAQPAKLEFGHDYPLPANNRILLWKKV